MNYWNSGTDLRAYLSKRLNSASAELASIDPDYLLAENADVLLTGLVQKHIPEPVRIEWSDVTRSEVQETKTRVHDQFLADRVYDVPASRVRLTFPICGDPEMLKYRASTFTLSPLEGEIKGKYLLLDVIERQLSAEVIKNRIANLRQHVDQRVEWANSDLRQFSSQVDQTLRRAYENRKQRILNDRSVGDALGIPIRATGQRKLPVAAQRKHVSLDTRQKQAKFVPEPELDEATYRDILDQVCSWTRGLERTPGTLAKLAEEELRDLLLAHLNGYWQGAAGGELFNGSGKTDILIRSGDRNVFIAECKVWTGPKAVEEAIDQLLGYLVWRDSKAALIFFIRTKGPGATINKLHTAIEAHCGYVMTKAGGNREKQVDYIFTADDEGRRVALAVIPVVQAG